MPTRRHAKTHPPREVWTYVRPRVTKRLLAQMSDRIVRAFHPHEVILFGSFAYGRPHQDSDVDLFVIMPSRESMAKRMIRVDRVARVRGVPLDVLVFTPGEVKRRLVQGDMFIEEVLTRGRVLYQRGRRRRLGS